MSTSSNQPLVLFLGRSADALADSASVGPDDKERKYLARIKSPISSQLSLVLPDSTADRDIPANSIAYYPIVGSIRYKSWWYFSSSDFIKSLAAAEANPSIAYHLVFIDSGGGEAFGCHEMFEALRNCKKPTLAFIDRQACSAAYYIASGCDKIYASSLFSQIGCIGVMCIMENDDEFYKKHGVVFHEYYSNFSPLKNKVFNDAADGKGEEFVKKFIDPMAEMFISDVKSARPSVSEEALQGETFYSAGAMAAGLIDGEMTWNETLAFIESEITPQSKPSININNIEL